ncbi:MAG: glycosyl hydrolase family 8 [Alphaproteobacteria bacterium]
MPRRFSRTGAVLAAVVASLLAIAPRAASAAPAHPFGSHPQAYTPGTIRPSQLGQATLDRQVSDFWDAWKKAYVIQACGDHHRVILVGGSHDLFTISEAHGYGMMLSALMAGHDPEARTIFDGLVAFYLDHPSRLTPGLMAWNQAATCEDIQGAESGSDGDMDIAYALLLADRQWGSCGTYDYRLLALRAIAAIKSGDLDRSGSYPKLGDWVLEDSVNYYHSTRTSDFIPDHFRVFGAVTGDTSTWNRVLDTTYGIVQHMQTYYSPSAGLLPDFIRLPLTDPQPAWPYFLEDAWDGAYVYNATRDPWRLATDFAMNGEPRARTAVAKLERFFRTSTGGSPWWIHSGYTLDGNPLPYSAYLSMAFVGPLVAGAIVDPENQQWLNDLWDVAVATPVGDEGYYEDSLKLMSMVVASGNWWSPERFPPASCSHVEQEVCVGGGTLRDIRIEFGGVGRGADAAWTKLAATLSFPDGRADGRALDAGFQVRIEDGAGRSSLLDLTSATHPVPGSQVASCDPRRDRWRTSGGVARYANASGALDAPACTAGSAAGLFALELDGSAWREVGVRLSTKGRALSANPGSSVRATVVLGADAGAGASGACGVSAALSCRPIGGRVRCE